MEQTTSIIFSHGCGSNIFVNASSSAINMLHTQGIGLRSVSFDIDGLIRNASPFLYRMNDFGTNGGLPLKALELKMGLFKSHVSSSFGFELPQVDVSTFSCQRSVRPAFVLRSTIFLQLESSNGNTQENELPFSLGLYLTSFSSTSSSGILVSCLNFHTNMDYTNFADALPDLFQFD